MSAIISPCGLYRYRLEREVDSAVGTTAIIMVNPSTADATENDATIRKLIGFSNANQWGRIVVGNLFAYRSKDVTDLAKVSDPIGPENDEHLDRILFRADKVIFAWGPVKKLPFSLRGRWVTVERMARAREHQPMCIGPVAKCGHPKHPLMLPYSSEILPWKAPFHI